MSQYLFRNLIQIEFKLEKTELLGIEGIMKEKNIYQGQKKKKFRSNTPSEG